MSPNNEQGQGVSGGVLFSLADTDHMAVRVALLAELS